MSWRLIKKTRKAPPGIEKVLPTLEEFEAQTREALNAPPDDKRRNEIAWPMHKLHYQKNRYLFDMHFKQHKISKKLLDYLIKEKIADGKLIAKWRRPGYERLCSLQVVTKSNMNFGGVGVCRTPLKQRRGQILPNVLTGCVSCASGDGGPIWWDDPVPQIVKDRIADIDPGKAELVNPPQPDSNRKDENQSQGAEDPAASANEASGSEMPAQEAQKDTKQTSQRDSKNDTAAGSASD
ncbi:Protein BUD31-like [Gracilariopsis chorda]|uniref:Protein BUD31-like n=1 Tax=Gracilariopsis chorda TaxID=448386 RepID=A0A2V3IE31_9FLOR|nr:Protein BUD31-like [Gracilariopsis chorda]|eukprot:PXF40345.1 Protein BUD31-like [Gracilariopsis chorda]